MSARAAFIAALIALLSLSSTPALRAQDAVLPAGVATSADLTGIYPGTTAGDCCWLGDDGTLRVIPATDALAVVLDVFVPQFALTNGPQRLFVTMDGGAEQRSDALGAGEHELLFPLQQPAASLDVRMRPAYTFVPSQLGMNQDPRHLSVLVRGVQFYSASQGLDLPADAPPVIVALHLATTVFKSGDRVDGTVTTSSNVVSVDARIGTLHVPVPKAANGQFSLRYRVPRLAALFKGSYDLIVTARNSAGAATERTVPITLR